MERNNVFILDIKKDNRMLAENLIMFAKDNNILNYYKINGDYFEICFYENNNINQENIYDEFMMWGLE